MNDRIEVPLIELHEHVFDASTATRMLWRLAEDMFKHKYVTADDASAKATARSMFRSPGAPGNGLSVLGLDARDLTPFPPTVAMLAGICWQRFGLEADFASMTLYADGDDFLSWHTDHDAMIGPAPGHAELVTFSFGSKRRLEFAKLGGKMVDGEPEIVEADYEIPSGSAYRMRPDAQRYFMHCVPKPLGKARQGARLSVIFFRAQRGAPAELWWTIVDARVNGANPPLYAGPASDAFIKACSLDHPVQIVTPLGITNSIYGAADYLKKLELFTDEHGAAASKWNHDRMARKGSRSAAIEDVDQTDTIVAAEHMLARVACTLCRSAAFGVRLTEAAAALVCAHVPDGSTVRLCVGCIQDVIGRPLHPSEFAVDPINRPVLQAFVLGCEHIGLAERRAVALERIGAIDATFGQDPTYSDVVPDPSALPQ